jgi:hypothetical protein
MVAAEFRLSNSLPLSTNKVRHFQQTRRATFSKQGAPLSANKARRIQQIRCDEIDSMASKKLP